MDERVPGECPDIVLASSPAAGHLRVLVVDDSEGDRQLTTIQLTEAWPFERDLMVECAANGAEALERVRRSQFALVVLDWNMPCPGGRDVLRTLRENGLRIPVVVVSDQRRDDVANDLESMAAAFVHKDDPDPITFRGAVAVALQLQGLLT